MEKGLIFTEDKKDIEVFFLKPQQPPPPECFNALAGSESPYFAGSKLIDDSIPSDNKDCYNDDLHLMSELDVNENSAGGGAHSGYVYDAAGVLKEIKDCCPVGHKGETGWKGYNSVYEVILDTIRSFEDTQLNIASETAQEILALSIEKKVKDYERKTT